MDMKRLKMVFAHRRMAPLAAKHRAIMETINPFTKTQLRRFDKFLLRIVPPAIVLLIRLIMGSCRVVRVENFDRAEEAISRAGGKAVFSTWHQRMSYQFYFFGARGLTVMISQSRDGEYAHAVAKGLGFKSVRGSSTRRGTTALREIIQLLKRGEKTGMLADGPLGPARVAKIGSVLMARSSGAPLIPVVWGANRCWTLNTWDRYLVPKPFARVVIYYGDPILVPPGARGESLESFRSLLEERLNEGARRCDLYFGEERPWGKEKRKRPGRARPRGDWKEG
jgi:lysophospholipid acyltransferase (LPLAT)-like uncharacterized protein